MNTMQRGLVAFVGAVMAVWTVGVVAPAVAQANDPHWPRPYCYGGEGGGGFGGFGGTRWCDGMPFPDGSRIRVSSGHAMGGYMAHAPHCVAGGGPFPAPAPGKCGGRVLG